MKHASLKTLAELGDVLQQIRAYGNVVERTPGTFYFRSKAFLHFHEDPAGLFADVKLGRTGFERMRVSTTPEQKRFLAAVHDALVAVALRPVRPKSKQAT